MCRVNLFGLKSLYIVCLYTVLQSPQSEYSPSPGDWYSSSIYTVCLFIVVRGLAIMILFKILTIDHKMLNVSL